jgi:hypothetical protein
VRSWRGTRHRRAAPACSWTPWNFSNAWLLLYPRHALTWCDISEQRKQPYVPKGPGTKRRPQGTSNPNRRPLPRLARKTHPRRRMHGHSSQRRRKRHRRGERRYRDPEAAR